ncbi:unnamed protein product [Clavelina lepadiformis]|uniref:Lipid-binding serum glycoprotein N-terminal domain-containing protein n=1 Tax=Clavelina lepadiformis TaxID=159417 RepID=A0ABP0FKX0_CLALP
MSYLLLLVWSYVALTAEGKINADCTSLAGVKLRIHKRGIDLVRDLANQYAQSNLDKLEIPDFDGTYDFSSGRSASYEFSNIKIPHLNPGNILLIPTPPNIVTMSMSGTKISVSGNWKASGSFPITIFGV